MSIKDDAIVQAFGPERRGSVRGLGFGALPSKVDAQAYQNQNMRQLNEKLLLLEQELREMKAEMLKGKGKMRSQAKGQMDTHMEKLRVRKTVEVNIGCMEVVHVGYTHNKIFGVMKTMKTMKIFGCMAQMKLDMVDPWTMPNANC